MLQSSSRRRFLALPLLAAPAVAYARYVEPVWLELTERKCELPNLARPVTLLHLSDFHASPVVPTSHIERSVGIAIDAAPDLICVTGDFITHRTGFDTDWYLEV